MEVRLSLEPQSLRRGPAQIDPDVLVLPEEPNLQPSGWIQAGPDPVFSIIKELRSFRSAMAGGAGLVEDEDGCLFLSVAFNDAEAEERASEAIARLSQELVERTGVLVALASYVVGEGHE